MSDCERKDKTGLDCLQLNEYAPCPSCALYATVVASLPGTAEEIQAELQFLVEQVKQDQTGRRTTYQD